jgi:hypothetical protein
MMIKTEARRILVGPKVIVARPGMEDRRQQRMRAPIEAPGRPLWIPLSLTSSSMEL